MAKSKVSVIDRIAGLFNERARLEAELAGDLEQVEIELVTAKNQLAMVRNAPVTLAEIGRRVDVFLAKAVAQGTEAMVPGAFAMPSYSPAQMNHIEAALSSSRTGFATLVALVGPDVIRERMVAAAVERAPGEPMEDVKRESEIKRLTDEIANLEIIRERFARQAEHQGIIVPRSEFADPQILLASDTDLGLEQEA